MGARHRLYRAVAKAALLFALAYWTLAIVTIRIFTIQTSLQKDAPAALALIILAPDILGTLWLLRRLRAEHPRDDARHAAMAFAISGPLAAGIGNVLGQLVGGYAELLFGSQFTLPGAVAFSIVWTIVVTSGAVIVWVGARFVDESGDGLIKNEHS